MFFNRRSRFHFGTSVCLSTTLVVVAISAIAQAGPFTGGNVVLMRGGDAANSQTTLAGGEVPAYLDAYSVTVSAGVATPTFIGSYPIPTGTLTLPGKTVNSHEGRLELSGNNQYLNFGGYQ